MDNRAEWQYKRGIKILGLSHGFAYNVETLIFNPIYFVPGEIYSQLANGEEIEEFEYISGLDSNCFILDTPDLPFDIRID
jgi:hypothetical protein